MDRVALEEGVILLLLDALGNGLFVPIGQVAGGGLALFAGFGALQGDEFLHGGDEVKGVKADSDDRWRKPGFAVARKFSEFSGMES